MLELQRLLDAGYEVSFTNSPDGYVAIIDGHIDGTRDGSAASTGETLWAAASPSESNTCPTLSASA
jgi:hypothetical protein